MLDVNGMGSGEEDPAFTWKRARRVAAWALLVILLLLWVIYLKRSVSAGGSDFRFSSPDTLLEFDRIVRERGEDGGLTFSLCLHEKTKELIGFSFGEILVNPSVENWSMQRFPGEGAGRWSGTIKRGDLSPTECTTLLFRFPGALKPAGKVVEFNFHVNYAVIAPKGDSQKLVVDPNRAADGVLKVKDDVLAGLLSHHFAWESIFGKSRQGSSSD